jgi:hypothetical protein
MADDALTAEIKKFGELIIQLRHELSAEKKVTEMLVMLAAGNKMRPATALAAARDTVSSLPITNPRHKKEVAVLLARFEELIAIDKVTPTLPPVEVEMSGVMKPN